MQEATQPKIELKDDHTDAVDVVLRHIYKVPAYDDARDDSWRFWLDVHLTADKYLEFDLSGYARNMFMCAALDQQDTSVIMDIIEAIDSKMTHDKGCLKLVDEMIEKNIGALVQNHRFCNKINENIDLRWKIINLLVAGNRCGTVQSLFLCQACIMRLFVSGRGTEPRNCMVCRVSNLVVSPRIIHLEKKITQP